MEDDPILQLVERFQKGVNREEAFQRIFQRFYPMVRLFFNRKGFSDDQSRDLTQEVFYRVFRTIDNFRHESSFERWLWEVANHVYLNELRRRKTEKRHAIEVRLDMGAPSEADIPEPVREGPLELVIKEEQTKALRAALAALPEQMRMCCMLRYGRGLKYQDIADVMNVSIETVKSHLHQARRRLTAELGRTEEPDTKREKPP